MKVFNFFSLLFSLLLSSEAFSQNVLAEMQATPLITRYDAAGNLYVLGRSEPNGSIGTTSLPSYGANDVFIAKFGFGSTLLWVKVLGSTGYDEGSYLGFTPSGNIDIAFSSPRILDLDPGTGTVNTTQDSTSNVVTFDPNGNYLSSKTFGSYSGWVTAIQYSGTTVNYIGNFSGRFDADYSTGTSWLTQPTTAFEPAFFAHYENNALVYASIFEGKITGFNTDYAGDLLLNLQIKKPFDADFRLGTTTTITPPTTNYHPCLMRVKADGSLVWAKILGTQLTGDETITFVALNSKPNNGNNIVIGSAYRYGGDIDPSPTNTVNISSTYSGGSFIAVFNSNGDLVGSKNFNKGTNIMKGLIAGNQGESLIYGFFGDTMVLSPSVQLTHRGKLGSFGGFASVLSSNFTPSATSQFYYGNGANSRTFIGDRYEGLDVVRYAIPGVAADTCDFNLTSSRGQVINKGFIIEQPILTSNENVSSDSYSFVYPNPANDWLNLNFEPVGAITIVNILGQKQEAKLVDGKIQISALEKGIYWLTVDGSAFKFIKE